jgi:hypothetical protein
VGRPHNRRVSLPLPDDLDPYVRVHGSRVHNLRAVDVAAPRDAFVAFTGVSGSGKASLAFGTIYAEAQRRVETLIPDPSLTIREGRRGRVAGGVAGPEPARHPRDALGPGAGDDGGRVVAAGTPEEVAEVQQSRTAPYLSARLRPQVEVPA